MEELTKPRYQIYYNGEPLPPQIFSDLHVQYRYGNRENPGEPSSTKMISKFL